MLHASDVERQPQGVDLNTRSHRCVGSRLRFNFKEACAKLGIPLLSPAVLSFELEALLGPRRLRV